HLQPAPAPPPPRDAPPRPLDLPGRPQPKRRADGGRRRGRGLPRPHDRDRARRPAALDGAGLLPRPPLPPRLHGRVEHPAEGDPPLLPAPRGGGGQGPLRQRLAGAGRPQHGEEPRGLPGARAAGGRAREDAPRERGEGVQGLTRRAASLAGRTRSPSSFQLTSVPSASRAWNAYASSLNADT